MANNSDERNEKYNNQIKAISKLIILSVLLPCIIVYVILVFVFKLGDVAPLFICVGLFNILLMVINYFSVSRTKKYDKKIRAEVISCERKKEYETSNGKECLRAEYYLVSFRIPVGNEEKIVEYISENKMTVGSYVKIYYNEKKESIITEKSLEECQSKSGIIFMTILICICFLIAACIIIIPKLDGVISTEEFWSQAIVYTVGIVFLIIGLLIIKNSHSKSSSKDQCKRVSATLTDYVMEESRDSDGDCYVSYFPVFEYQLNEETLSYQSSVSSTKKSERGSKTNLYIDLENGKIFEEEEVKQSAILGYILTFTGIVVLLFIICFTVIKN